MVDNVGTFHEVDIERLAILKSMRFVVDLFKDQGIVGTAGSYAICRARFNEETWREFVKYDVVGNSVTIQN